MTLFLMSSWEWYSVGFRGSIAPLLLLTAAATCKLRFAGRESRQVAKACIVRTCGDSVQGAGDDTFPPLGRLREAGEVVVTEELRFDILAEVCASVFPFCWASRGSGLI